MMSTSKKLGFLTLILIAGIGLSGCTKYVKGDIDDIVYAEPSEEAKNFDIEGYINSLPQVEYDKIDYPIKETYTYNFNGYSMTIDIPEGFEAYEIPLERKPRVVDSDDIASSTWNGGSDGPGSGRWKYVNSIDSENSLCIYNVKDNKQKWYCNGIRFQPEKSLWKGVSYRDIFMHNSNEYQIHNVINDYRFAVKYRNHNQGQILTGIFFLNDNQVIFIHNYQQEIEKKLSEDIYFSIIDSIKIQKKNEIL